MSYPPECPRCRTVMKPLARTFFCPRDCDKKPQLTIDFQEEAPTRDFCPNCKSSDTAPFPTYWGVMKRHCIDCGHVWP